MASERAADLATIVAELRRLEAAATAMDASWAVADYLTALRIHAPALLDALATATAERDRYRAALEEIARLPMPRPPAMGTAQRIANGALAPDSAADPARKLAAMAPNRPLGAREADSSATDTTGPQTGILGGEIA